MVIVSGFVCSVFLEFLLSSDLGIPHLSNDLKTVPQREKLCARISAILHVSHTIFEMILMFVVK